MNEEDGKVSARTAFNAMRAGDKAGKEVVDKYIKYLACGITNTINIFQPDILCIGGGVCNEGDPLLLPLKELVAKEIYTKNSAKNTEIVIAKLGNDAGIIGAAFLGLSHKSNKDIKGEFKMGLFDKILKGAVDAIDNAAAKAATARQGLKTCSIRLWTRKTRL